MGLWKTLGLQCYGCRLRLVFVGLASTRMELFEILIRHYVIGIAVAARDIVISDEKSTSMSRDRGIAQLRS